MAPTSKQQMQSPAGGHTVLWVPRFWPAVGGTEFHSHQLALHLAREQRVTVVTHCSSTEDKRAPLVRLAAQAVRNEHGDSRIRSITIAPDARYRHMLERLGEHHGKRWLARMAYQGLFGKAFRNDALRLIQNAERVHCIYNGLTESAVLAADLARHTGIPFIFTPNVLDTESSASAWASKGFRKLYARADRLIALTEHEAQWLVDQGVHADRIAVVPYGPILSPGIEPDRDDPALPLLSHRYALFLGRLVPEKGYRTVLEAFRQLSTTDQHTHLVLVGPADEEAREMIREFDRQLGGKRVHLLSEVSQPMKTALLEQATVLCVPSTRESLGGVYLEAMACATPVIGLDRPVSRCVIDHGADGLLVPNTAEEVRQAMNSLIDKPELARSMGLAGQSKVAGRYTWPIVTEQIRRCYAEAAQHHQGGGHAVTSTGSEVPRLH